MFFLASMHGCMAILDRMNLKFQYEWDDQLYLATGALALGLLVILAVTSLPSVAASMSWMEFTFVQSKLGWVTLLTAFFHVFFLGWPAIVNIRFRCYILVGGNQLSIFIPFLTILLKLPLLIPYVDKKLTLIRRGHERKTATPPAVLV
ncbi:metalloreductase STEAP3-like [Oratosquilla oratoria]